MEFGIALFSNVDAWKTVKRAEELGFSHAWFYDSQLLAPDIFISMALAAEHSSKIKLASGVVIPTNRIAPVCADAFATLNKLAPGRIIFGVGTGFTGRNTMGMGPMKLSAMREYIRVVYGLLKGETIEWEFEGERKKIRFLNPEFGMINITDKIPLHVSAFAPKARKMTAEIGDGWITFSASPERATHEVAEMATACREVGRDPKTLYTTAFALGCVLKPGESAASPRAKAQAGPMAVVTLHGLIERSLTACCRLTSRSSRARIASSMRPISPPMRNTCRCTRCICWACAPRKKNISPKTSCAKPPSPRPRKCCAIACGPSKRRATISLSCS